jgi:hypothetical protein
MAYVTTFVDENRPLTEVKVNEIVGRGPACTLDWHVGKDWLSTHFSSLAEIERFHALVGSALQDCRLAQDDSKPEGLAEVDLAKRPGM